MSFKFIFLGIEMKELTKAEEQVMQALWSIDSGFLKEIIEALPLPRPAYTTVSTVIRILETKGFVEHVEYGKTHKYFPKVKKEDYANDFLSNFVNDYFENSFPNMVSFFTKKEKISLEELDEIQKLIEKSRENDNA